jgi:putative transposase
MNSMGVTSAMELCVWQHVFPTFDDARRAIRDWLQWYNQERRIRLGYRSPVQYRAQQATQVA